MSIGISGDTATIPPTATTDDIPGTSVPIVAPMLQGSDGSFVFTAGDRAGRQRVSAEDTLQLILAQLNVITLILAEGLNTTTDFAQAQSEFINDPPIN